MEGESRVSDCKEEKKKSSWSQSSKSVDSQPSSPDSEKIGSGGPNDAENGGEMNSSPSNSGTSISSSTPNSSCVISDGSSGLNKWSSAESAPLVLGGCKGCHMYVMLQRQNPRCPRCNSTDLVNYFFE